ncbi:MAG: GerMN domain-containing protein [Cyanobacteria bacterium TGS_CYA1]|nr:GerMN domain-containing protein [Cyanobacteria bacterium TGS_CYA1]
MKTSARISLLSLLLSVSVLGACNIFPDPKESGEKVEVIQKNAQIDTSKDVKKDEVEIYFAKKNGEELELVAVHRPIRGDNQLKDTIEELLRGPTPEEEKSGLLSEIPKGTILLGIKDGEGETEIDLSKRFSTGSISSMQTRLDQMTKTVSPLANEKKVYLDVEGKRLDASSFDGLEIKQPIN